MIASLKATIEKGANRRDNAATRAKEGQVRETLKKKDGMGGNEAKKVREALKEHGKRNVKNIRQEKKAAGDASGS